MKPIIIKKMVRNRNFRMYSLVFTLFIGTIVSVAFQWRETDKQGNIPSVLQANCIAPTVEDIFVHYSLNDVTSGRMNTPDIFVDCLSKSKRLGFYDVVDRSSNLKPPVVAKVIVSFEAIPWNHANTDQNIVAIIVTDNRVKFNPLPIQPGDSIERVKYLFEKETIIDNIHYILNDDCAIAVKVKGGVISKYIVIYCGNKNFSITSYHKDVKAYLD